MGSGLVHHFPDKWHKEIAKPSLMKIIADVANSSLSDVKEEKRAGIILRASVMPRDKGHELYVVSKLNSTASLLATIKSQLQNDIIDYGLILQRISSVRRRGPRMSIPGYLYEYIWCYYYIFCL